MFVYFAHFMLAMTWQLCVMSLVSLLMIIVVVLLTLGAHAQ